MQISSGTVQANGIELHYEARGPEGGEPILFIMGLSAQMVFWPEPLLDHLAGAGYRVIRFDNRDVGLSTRFRAQTTHGPLMAMLRYLIGLPLKVAYTLHDMVRDVTGLMDALGIERAHVVGASMGGMIGQLLAIHEPGRVLSLTSIMSSPNSRLLPPPKFSALKALVGPRVKIRNVEEYVAFGKTMMKRLGGTLPQGHSLDAMFRLSWERGLHPRGIRQQFMAIMATGSWRTQLRRIEVPTAVIHGDRDPLIRPAGGRMTARNIPGATLHIIRGMGHDLPDVILDRIGDIILANAARARGETGAVAATA